MLEKGNQQSTGDETADMGPEGNARLPDVAAETADNLNDKPEPEHDQRGDIESAQQDQWERNEKHAHTGARIEQQIGAKHAGDCTAGTNQRNGRAGDKERMRQRRRHTADEIEND